MALAVTDAPRFGCEDASRIAEELFGVRGAASPLPSERDQNFLIRAEPGDRFVLKIANSGERREVLEFQNEILDRLAERCPGLRFPRALSGIHETSGYLVR